MERNIILAGVGGQGILSMAYVISQTALKKGLNVKQAEVHGMAQRGGAVQSHLRVSSKPIASDLVPKGGCNLIISVEPLEATRYLDYLSPDGTVVTSTSPVKNISDYPAMDGIWAELDGVKLVIPVDAEPLAKKAGSSLAQNTVILGAASPFLELPNEAFVACLTELWTRKGPRVVETNLKAFESGRRMAALLTEAARKGAKPGELRALSAKEAV